jgi:hypothetical protein
MIRIFLAKNAIVGFGVTDAFAFERHPHRIALASDCRPVPSLNFPLAMPGVHFRAHSAFPSRKPPVLLLDPCRSRFRTNFRNDLQVSDFSGLAVRISPHLSISTRKSSHGRRVEQSEFYRYLPPAIQKLWMNVDNFNYICNINPLRLTP